MQMRPILSNAAQIWQIELDQILEIKGRFLYSLAGHV